jgi:hypothetical protein
MMLTPLGSLIGSGIPLGVASVGPAAAGIQVLAPALLAAAILVLAVVRSRSLK